jgi:hypothetical protein
MKGDGVSPGRVKASSKGEASKSSCATGNEKLTGGHVRCEASGARLQQCVKRRGI